MTPLTKKQKIIQLYETETVPRKLTLNELAERVGCSRSYCEQIINVYKARQEALKAQKDLH